MGLKAKISSALRKSLTENRVVATYEENGVTYKVIDTISSSPLYKSQRSLKFKIADSDIIYTHSSIHLDPKERLQPYSPICQEILDKWREFFSPEKALVLGCAGCSIPRYLCLSDKAITVTGVELLPLLITIAKEHFLLDELGERFSLEEGDAFRYIKSCESTSKDIIFVDIFDTNRLPDEVFSKEFLNDVKNIASENSIVIFNFIDSDPRAIKDFAREIDVPQWEKFVIATENRCFLALAKSNDKEKLDAFRKSLDNCEIIN